jgi:hypothetical protein
MAKYEIFGGKFKEDLILKGVEEFETSDDALDAAYNHACAVYDKDPFRTVSEIQEELEVDEQEADEIYIGERDESIDYYVNNLDEEDYDGDVEEEDFEDGDIEEDLPEEEDYF